MYEFFLFVSNLYYFRCFFYYLNKCSFVFLKRILIAISILGVFTTFSIVFPNIYFPATLAYMLTSLMTGMFYKFRKKTANRKLIIENLLRMKATFQKYTLNFKRPSGTSRGVMTEKETWFLFLEKDGKKGIGECGVLRGLSYDDRLGYSDKMQWVCDNIHLGKEVLWESLREWPSIQFGVEQAFMSIESKNPMLLFPSAFTSGMESIPINGLVWMGTPEFMKQQIDEKLQEGFRCIKLKIGAIHFQEELQLIRYIRSHFSPETIEIRVDANGGFDLSDALDKIHQLSEFKIHSIEQPIKQKQYDSMAELCRKTSLSIALDEELIGVIHYNDKENLLRKIRPQYLILKPSLIGGIKGSEEWIEVAKKLNISWWVTSALESNVGLNAIAQWTFTLKNSLPQGLGTGSLYTNNITSPLVVKKGHLWYDEELVWDFENLQKMSRQIESF